MRCWEILKALADHLRPKKFKHVTKLKDRITPQINSFQWSPSRCENEMGKAGRKGDGARLVGCKSCVRQCCVCVRKFVYVKVLCVKELYVTKLCVKDCVWKSRVWKSCVWQSCVCACVCVWESCAWQSCVEEFCVTKLCVTKMRVKEMCDKVV